MHAQRAASFLASRVCVCIKAVPLLWVLQPRGLGDVPRCLARCSGGAIQKIVLLAGTVIQLCRPQKRCFKSWPIISCLFRNEASLCLVAIFQSAVQGLLLHMLRFWRKECVFKGDGSDQWERTGRVQVPLLLVTQGCTFLFLKPAAATFLLLLTCRSGTVLGS